MKKFLFIDALRGLAIFGVLIVHAGQFSAYSLPNWLQPLVNQGARGVQLFFVVSALTLFLSLSNRNKTEKRLNLNFFIRRFFRIAPLFYCAIVFNLICRYWLKGLNLPSASHILSVITFTNGWNPYWINTLVPGGWSIAIEMVFYVFVPYLFIKINSLKKAVILTLITLGIRDVLLYILQGRALIDDSEKWKEFLYFFFPNQLPVFCLGFILYFLFIQENSISHFSDTSNKIRPDIKGFWLLLISLILFILLLVKAYQPTSIYSWLLPDHFLYSIDFVLLGLALSLYSFPFIVNDFLCHLGKVSFSAYITHFTVLPIVDKLLHKGYLNLHLNLSSVSYFAALFLIGLVVTMALSTLSYQYIEKPGLGVGRNLISMLERG